MKNTHENNARPAHDTAKSALSKTLDNLAKEEAALSAAQADLDSFNAKLDSATTLPKNAAHNGAEREGAVSFHAKRVERAQQAVAEAQAAHDQAEYLLTEAQVLDRAEAVAAFDEDEWAAEFAAEAQTVVDKFLGQLYDLREIETEGIALGVSIGLDGLIRNPENRARVHDDTGRKNLTLDDERLSPVWPSYGLGMLKDSLVDSRYEAERAEAERVEREERAALAAEQKADREREQAYRQAERNGGARKFEYMGGSGARPMVTRDQYGNVIKGMTTTPDGVSTVAVR